MATIVSNLMRGQIALLNQLLRRMDIKSSRKLQDALGALGTRVLTENITYSDETFARFEASWATPNVCAPGKAILYLHGGAYTAGTLVYARCFGGILAEKTGYPALCVAYRLAPEHPYPAALDDALEAYERLLDTYAPQDIVLAGESAGGGLCFCLCLRLRELGLPMPGCLVALSPWTDLEMAGDYSEAAVNDPVLNADNLRQSATMYAGENRKLPTVSPLFGDLKGLPPVLILAGADEILLRDSAVMAQRLWQSGGDCEFHVARDMWHVYVLYGVPEAKTALERIRRFILQKMQGEENDQSGIERDPRMDQAGQCGEHLPDDENARLDADVPPVGDADGEGGSSGA